MAGDVPRASCSIRCRAGLTVQISVTAEHSRDQQAASQALMELVADRFARRTDNARRKDWAKPSRAGSPSLHSPRGLWHPLLPALSAMGMHMPLRSIARTAAQRS